jgi:hypothetical protein
MWGRGTIIYIVGMVVAVAFTLIGTYYFVEWVVPPDRMYGGAKGGTGRMGHPTY